MSAGNKAAWLAACMFLALPSVVGAEVLSESIAKVTQLKIVLSTPDKDRARPTAWGVDSTYIGPGDIKRLLGVDIYLDSRYRIASVKVTRESTTGDVITLLFNDVLEISVETLKKNPSLPHKDTRITIHSPGSITFP